MKISALRVAVHHPRATLPEINVHPIDVSAKLSEFRADELAGNSALRNKR